MLNEVSETLINEYQGAQPSMVLGKDGDTYVRQEVTAKQLDEQRLFVESIREFITSSSDVTPAFGALDVDHDNGENYQNSVGKSSIASIMYARDHDILLFSDDLSLRGLARQHWAVQGVSSQRVLQHLAGCGLLTEDEYHAALMRLVLGNYRFVSVNVQALIWVLKKHGMTPAPEVKRILQSLEGPDCSDDTAVVVAADLIKFVWIEKLLYHQKQAILDIVLEALASGRIGVQVLTKFKHVLDLRFALVPWILDAITKYIDSWQRHRDLASGLLVSP